MQNLPGFVEPLNAQYLVATQLPGPGDGGGLGGLGGIDGGDGGTGGGGGGVLLTQFDDADGSATQLGNVAEGEAN